MSKNQEHQKNIKSENRLWLAMAKLEESDYFEPHIFNPNSLDKFEIEGESLRPAEDLFPERFKKKTLKLVIQEVCDFWNGDFDSLVERFKVLYAQNLPLQEWIKRWCKTSYRSENYSIALRLSIYGWYENYLRKRQFILDDYIPKDYYDINLTLGSFVIKARCELCGYTLKTDGHVHADGVFRMNSLTECPKCSQSNVN
jgi:hypothetical protein